MSSTARTLIIGLDGATWTVLRPFMEAGLLPNLSALQAKGCWGELRSTLPPLTAPAWASFLTGKNPGKHGVFHFVAMEDEAGGNARAEIVDGRSIQSPTLWDVLGHYGQRVGVINVPMSYPPRPVNGFMVTCLLTPPNAPVFTYPAELSQELAGYQIDLDRFIAQKPFERDEQGNPQKRIVKPSLALMEEFLEMEEKRGQAALRLMQQQAWDVFMVVFTATDRMGHYLWPYHRAADLDGSAESAALHASIRKFYQRLDEQIGQLVQEAGEACNVIVMSDHGMGPIYSKNTHWNNWLYQQGYLAVEKGSQKTTDGWLLKFGIPRDKLRKWLSWVPGLRRSKLYQKAKSAKSAQPDFKRSKAYYMRIYDPVGGIRVQGDPAERAALCQVLADKIKALRDPVTGKAIVREILRREEVYVGPAAEKMPDLILLMHPEYGSSDRLSSYSSIVTERPEINDPGGHHLEGIFIGSGPDFKSGGQELHGLQITDLAPLTLHLAGLPVSQEMDGHAPVEALRQARPVQKAAEPGKWQPDLPLQPELEFAAAGEDEQVRDRLRALGYLD